MSNLMVRESERNYNRAEMDLIKATVAAGASDLELKWFLYQCRHAGLDPLAKQIYCIPRNVQGVRKMTVQVGIDGLRAIADRTGAFAGSDAAVFAYDHDYNLVSATVTVYRFVQGERVAWSRTAFWKEYCPARGQDSMWLKMPHAMLAKCAEALALRSAFPAQMSGLYTTEEMVQGRPADSVEYEASARVVKSDVVADAETGEIIEEAPQAAVKGRVNDSESACGVCHAPSGKPHTAKCTAA